MIVNSKNPQQLEQAALKLMMDGKGVRVLQVADELRLSAQQATKVLRGLWRKALVKPFFHDPEAFAKFSADQVLANSTWVSSKLRTSVKPRPALSRPKMPTTAEFVSKFRGGEPPGSGQQKNKKKDFKKLGKGDEGRKMPVIEKVRAGSAPGAQTRGSQPQRQAETRSR